MLYGEYLEDPNDSNSKKIDTFTADSKECTISLPIISGEECNINTFSITSFEDAQNDLIERTKSIWQSIKSNTSIFSFAIASSPDGSVSSRFREIFGESSDIFSISNSNEYVKKTIENDIPTSIMNKINNTSPNVSYAADSLYRRLEVINYSQTINYANGSILGIEDANASYSEFCNNTYMVATTPIFTVIGGGICENINLAIEERPKSSVNISKNVSHLKITLSDGNTLIDCEPNQNVKYLMALPGYSLTAIMDDELVHGATIQIQYQIKLENTSEYDNLANYFPLEFLQNNINYLEEFKDLFTYYNTTSLQDIINYFIPTRYYIYDYLDNNSIFDEANSPDYWSVAYDILPISDNIDLDSQTILEIKDLYNIYLVPGKIANIKLSTSKLMTIADTDLLTYNNYVEVVQYSNVVGRRMYNNIPGNLDITDEERVQNLEPDEAKAETVTRVPPFGKDLSYYTTIIGIIILAIEIIILSTLKIKIKNLKNKYIIR